MEKAAADILNSFPDLAGFYCTSSQVDALVRQLIAAHKENSIRVIVHDLCGWDPDYLRKSYVDYCFRTLL